MIFHEPQFVVSGEVLSNESMKPSKVLWQKLGQKENHVELFERNFNLIHKLQTTFTSSISTNTKGLLVMELYAALLNQ